MNQDMKRRIREEASYILSNSATVRHTAARFRVSKSTVHTDMKKRLREFDLDLYYMVKEVMQFNKSQRSIRGGKATKKKFENKK